MPVDDGLLHGFTTRLRIRDSGRDSSLCFVVEKAPRKDCVVRGRYCKEEGRRQRKKTARETGNRLFGFSARITASSPRKIRIIPARLVRLDLHRHRRQQPFSQAVWNDEPESFMEWSQSGVLILRVRISSTVTGLSCTMIVTDDYT